MSLPEVRTALITEDGKLVKTSLPLPVPKDGQILVKVSHVAQNPVDVVSLPAGRVPNGSVLGCDLVGTVAQLGRAATKFKIGQAIASLIWGGRVSGIGAYSEYTIVDERWSFPVPEGITLEQAATLPSATGTSALVLLSQHCLNVPKNSNDYILVWGGTSSVGQYGIQLARHYGLQVVTTCSPRHFDHVKALGASHAFDYRDDDVIAKIKDATGSGVKYVYDTIGNKTSSVLASQAISEMGGTLCTIRPGKAFTEDVTKQTKVTAVLLWSIHGAIDFSGYHFPLREGDSDLVANFYEELPKLVSSGVIKPNISKVFNGLDEVNKGYQEYSDGLISNYKIVYAL